MLQLDKISPLAMQSFEMTLCICGLKNNHLGILWITRINRVMTRWWGANGAPICEVRSTCRNKREFIPYSQIKVNYIHVRLGK